MDLATDSQLRYLIRDAEDEVVAGLNATHNKDFVAYQLFGSASSLLNKAAIYLHNTPPKEDRQSAWRLVTAAASLIKGIEPRAEKLQSLVEMRSMFRLD